MNLFQDIDFLKQKSVEFNFSTDLNILTQLKSTLESKTNGAGLAAPQIGHHKKVFIGKLSDGYKFFINPKIIKLENPFINKNEGCLSFPGKWISTIRHQNVTLSYFDEDQREHTDEFANFAAIVVSHEFDHLEGKLMFECQPPSSYAECFCGSGKKFKFCCSKLL